LQSQQRHKDIRRTLPTLHPNANLCVCWFEEVLRQKEKQKEIINYMNNSYFGIYQACTSQNVRPPISFKIREYFEQFVTENILKKKNIVIGGKWIINLSIIFIEEGG
jgi:hypothetical protein